MMMVVFWFKCHYNCFQRSYEHKKLVEIMALSRTSTKIIWIDGGLDNHYNDVTMGAIASQITSLTIVYSIVYSDADQRKHQSSASIAFVDSPHKWPVTRKIFPFDDVIMRKHMCIIWPQWITGVAVNTPCLYTCIYWLICILKTKAPAIDKPRKIWRQCNEPNLYEPITRLIIRCGNVSTYWELDIEFSNHPPEI